MEIEGLSRTMISKAKEMITTGTLRKATNFAER